MTRLDTTFARAEDSLGFLLWKSANVLQRLHADCLRDLDVTPAQFSLLTCLLYLHQDGGGPVTASRIVAHTGMDKMSVSDLLATLKRKKLITKTAHPTDGRSFLVTPTAAGERTTNAAVRRIEALDRRFFEQTADPAALHTALLVLAEGLRDL